MKPIRIFLLRDMTTALFIVSYYRQENMQKDDFRDICIVLYPKAYSDTYAQKIILSCPLIAGIIFEEIYIFYEQDCGYMPMSLRNIFRDRKQKFEYFNSIKTFFRDKEIDPNLITEVYHGNGTLHQYFKFLYPKVKLIVFEHGISDIKAFLVKHYLVNRLKEIAKCLLGRFFFIFYPYRQDENLLVTLLASEIAKLNKKDQIKSINPRFIKEVAREVVKDDFIEKNFLNNENNHTAVILLSDTFKLAHIKEEGLSSHRDFAKYIIDVIKKLTPQINTIVLKTRGFDPYFPEIKRELKAYFKDYSLFFLDEMTKSNYPIEYYLEIIRPRVIFGDASSGLFYSKALMPEIEVYTYHEYAIAYQRQHFSEAISEHQWITDYQWINNIFYEKYKDIFNDILPVKIEFKK